MILIAFVIFYIIFSIYSDMNQIVKHLEKINPYFIFPILLSFTTSLFIKSIRQYFLLTKIDIHISLKQNILIYFTGLSMYITPGAMGEVIKSHFLLRNYNEPISKTTPIVIVERYQDALATFSLLTIFFMINRITILITPIITIGIFFLVCSVIIQKRNIFEIIQRKLTRIKFLKFLEKSSVEFNNSLFSLFNKKNLLKYWVISLLAVTFDAIGIFFCFQALGLNFNFVLTTIFGFSSFLFGALSLLPSGIGVTELSFVKLLSSYGIDISTAAALILFIRILSDLYITCIGVIATKLVLKNKFHSI